MNFRKAKPEDVASLNALVNGAYRGESSRKGWTTEADLLDGIRTSNESLTEMINRTGSIILVAENKDGLQACVHLEKQNDALYLGMLTVQPEMQAQGLGAQLLWLAEERARELHCDKIKMTVITARDTLIAYYKRKGYIDTGERFPFPNDLKFGIQKQPLEFLVMEKKVNK